MRAPVTLAIAALVALGARAGAADDRCANAWLEQHWERQAQAERQRDLLRVFACSRAGAPSGVTYFYAVLLGLGEDTRPWPLGEDRADADVAESDYREEVRIGLGNAFVFTCFAVPIEDAESMTVTIDADDMRRAGGQVLEIPGALVREHVDPERPCLIRLDCEPGRLPSAGGCERGVTTEGLRARDLVYRFITSPRLAPTELLLVPEALRVLRYTGPSTPHALYEARRERVAAALDWLAEQPISTCDARTLRTVWRRMLYGLRVSESQFTPGCDERQLNQLFRLATHLAALMTHAEFDDAAHD